MAEVNGIQENKEKRETTADLGGSNLLRMGRSKISVPKKGIRSVREAEVSG